MSDCFVIMYSFYEEGYSLDRVATVCKDLTRAQIWLTMERLGKPWTDDSYIEGDGLGMRLVTNFSKTSYSTYTIQKYKLEE